jgi:tRNA uracil 4-sulfurtransferase
MDKYLIVHYGELGLKGGNKGYFQNTLKKNLMAAVREIGVKSQIQYLLGRFIVKLPADLDETVIIGAVSGVPGIVNFLIAHRVDLDFDKISKKLVELLPRDLIVDQGFETFCVRVKRSQDKLPFERMKSERDFGAVLLKADIALSVKMKDPDFLVSIECFADKAYIAFGKYDGVGGLPVGTGGRVICLLSSGFDSPVAAFSMMKRGAKVDFVHFSGQPYSKKDEEEQVKKLVKILVRYEGGAKLFIVPFGDIQKKISTNLDVPAKLRVILYRRLMFKIAEKIAKYGKTKALVTGESFGQVASQTLNNMAVVDEVTDMLVFRPLIGMDKTEIIDKSREIGTHDISALPCTDTCSLFMPSNPEVSGKMYEVLEAEGHIDFDGFVKKAFDEREVLKF